MSLFQGLGYTSQPATGYPIQLVANRGSGQLAAGYMAQQAAGYPAAQTAAGYTSGASYPGHASGYSTLQSRRTNNNNSTVLYPRHVSTLYPTVTMRL